MPLKPADRRARPRAEPADLSDGHVETPRFRFPDNARIRIPDLFPQDLDAPWSGRAGTLLGYTDPGGRAMIRFDDDPETCFELVNPNRIEPARHAPPADEEPVRSVGRLACRKLPVAGPRHRRQPAAAAHRT